MGLSLRAYARHRGVTLAAVQKARQTGRISALADGSIDPAAADAAWSAAAAARRAPEKAPADSTRVVLPARSLATAEATVRAVLAQHGASADKALTLADARLANELLRVEQRAAAIAAQKVTYRVQERAQATEAVDKRIVDALIANAFQVICEYVDPWDVPAALDRLRALQARWVPGTVLEAHLPPEKMPEALEGAVPTPKSNSAPCQHASDERPIDCLPADGQPEGEAEHTALQAPLDEQLGGGGGHAMSRGEEIEAMPGPIDPTGAADPRLQCGTCANMGSNGWCHRQRFFVTPLLPACAVYYEPVSAGPSRQ